MKKLVKPEKSIEELGDALIEAFCDYDGCSPNCKLDTIASCLSVGSDDSSDDDIIF